MNVIKAMNDRMSELKTMQHRFHIKGLNEESVSYASGVAIGIIEVEIQWLEDIIKEMENENGTSHSVHE